MNKQQPKTKEEARQYAIGWQNFTSEHDLSYAELAVLQTELETIGEKFGLLEEFKENGII